MRKDDCIFCKIAAGDIPSNTVYEDERFRVILDLNPASKGHALVLPKNHADDIFDLSEEDRASVLSVAARVAAAMKKGLCCSGINIVQNNGESAGQTVKHFHLHIIPRYDGDSAMVLWNPGKSDPEEQKKTAESIKAALE